MNRKVIPSLAAGAILLTASCSKRERSDPDAEVWAEIEARAAENAPSVTAGESLPAGEPDASETIQAAEEFSAFARRLEEMKNIRRGAGQTLLAGDSLVLDYQAHFVRMDGSVRVTDDHGELETESLIGRFSASNQVEYIEAKGGVSLVSGDRRALSDEARYNYLTGTVQLDGQSMVDDGGNRLSGERIRFWVSGDRRMICEPNALIVIAGGSGAGADGLPEEYGETEIRAGKIVYDESLHRVDILERVRLRNEQVAMNCDELHLYLKDNNEIDWIDAESNVIIQSEDRKALADRATYDADEGKFTLEGHPMVTQGQNVMTGDRIFIWPETRGAVCENARALLHLDAETKAKLLKDLND